MLPPWAKLIVFLLIVFRATLLSGNVESTSSKIDFVADGVHKMSLGQDGLGILTQMPQATLDVNGNAIIGRTLSVGTDSSAGNLNLAGTVFRHFTTVSGNATLGESSFVFADSQSGNQTLTLPYAGNATGQVFEIKKTSDDHQTELFAAEGIEFAQNLILSSASSGCLPSVTLISDGHRWYINNIEGTRESDRFVSDNLVMYLKFDTSGDIKDHGPHAFVVERVNFSTSTNGFVNGLIRGGMEFDGVDDRIEIPDHDAIDFTTTLSSAVWVKRFTLSPGSADLSEYDRIVGKSSAWGAFPRIESNDKIMVQLHFDDGSSTGELEDGAITDSEWHFMVCTFDSGSGEVCIYMDGVLVRSWTGYAGKVIVSNTQKAYISNGNPFWGVIDELRLYNCALSPSQVKAIYRSTVGGL
jgi:hypothetical protein